MGNKLLKGLTIKFGGDTTDLNKSLEKVEKQGRSLSSELGQINRALKLDPTNTELLAQKQKVLADAISNTEDKLGTLKEAEKQVQAQFERGEVSQEQVRALRREIIETEAKLIKYKNAVKETAETEKKLADGAEGAAKELDDQADKTKKAEKATNDMDDSVTDLAKGGLAVLTTAAIATVTAVATLTEESREYRNEQAKLGAAFKASNHDAEAATKTYEELQSVIGETDQSVEAAQQIALLAESEKDAAEWAGLAAGVISRFGDALQPETFFEAANETLKLGEATGAYTQMLEGCGESVQAFNEGLVACNTEQEKQEYMLGITKKLLGSAATEYKRTNAEVIRANQATEKWHKSTAKIGKTVEPVVTDIKELGAAVLEAAGEPLEETADFIRSDVIPAVKSVSSWTNKNMPAIKAGLIGVTTALVAYKVATVAATVAHKGLKGAIMETTAAEKALKIAQAATPWGLITVAVAGLTAAQLALASATGKTTDYVDVLTEEERELMEASRAAADAFCEQQDATQDAMGAIDAEMGNVQNMADELLGLADASGKVQEKDRARADFILGELNKALGTEYTMVDGVIQKYDELEQTIYELIQAKLANSLLEEGQTDYLNAQKELAEAMRAQIAAEKDYQSQLTYTNQLQKEYNAYDKEVREMRKSANADQMHAYDVQLGKMEEDLKKQQRILSEKKSAYETASADFINYSNTIIEYEAAQQFVIEGNYGAAKKVLLDKGIVFGEYADTVDEETARVLDTLQMEAVMAGIKAEEFRRKFEAGAAGYTEEMVMEAQKGYEAALDEFANAYADAHSVGEDLVSGMTAGAESKRPGLLAKARSLVQGFLNATRQAADSHSPSRKAIAIFEDIGEGAVIGVENKTEDVAHAGENQAAALLNAYRAQEINAQRSIRNVADQQAARHANSQMIVATANSPMLEKILSAIEKGQVLMLDGEALVGATAKQMDSALGRRRFLAARGAI